MIGICMVVTWSKYGAGLIGRLTVAHSISIRRRSVENRTWNAIRFNVLREFWIHRETLSFSDISLARIFIVVAMQIPDRADSRSRDLPFDWMIVVEARVSVDWICSSRRTEAKGNDTVKCERSTGVNRTLFFHGSRAAAQLLSATSHARVI